MTNTLHRFGTADSFHDDFVIFAIASRGKNEQGALEKLREFLRLAATFGPVNLGGPVATWCRSRTGTATSHPTSTR
jgi:hypothetical protein